MLDFLLVSVRRTKTGGYEVYPKFIIGPTKDLMIRGGRFYAIWDDETGLWSTDKMKATELIDRELDIYTKNHAEMFGESSVRVLHLWDSDTGSADKWKKYCEKQMPDIYHNLDEKIAFLNTEVRKEDYSSRRLNYALEPGSIESYDRLMSVLYSPPERMKIEWAIGAVVSGDSKKIQKFVVLYGGPKTGKSTVLNIIEKLFSGYCSVFDAKTLGSATNAFALEAFKSNPLVAIQQDGDLSRIEDNTRLNSLVSHETMTVNEKYKELYTSSFNSFLFMGTNKPVKITDAKSGIIRRLIDVSPTGERVELSEYNSLVKKINFELGAIAKHCLDVYLLDPDRYEAYVPIAMLGASNDFYNYILDSYDIFARDDGTSLRSAWEMYNQYCSEAKVPYPMPLRSFKEELKNYFKEFKDRDIMEDGTRVRSYYKGFKMTTESKPVETKSKRVTIDLKMQPSTLDILCADCPAQYASDSGTPTKRWANVDTTLKDLDTTQLHYLKLPENHIVIDFDITDKDGNKSLERNLIEASKFPATYTELSKSGKGVHLHYIYSGDVKQLAPLYSDKIEVKVFTGNSSLRRKLTLCNNLQVETISSGLPLKEKKGEKVLDFEGFKNEKALRTMIFKNLNKEYCPGTKPSIEHIYKSLEDAYERGVTYDVSDLKPLIFDFAAKSTHHSILCTKMVEKMHFKSKEKEYEDKMNETPPLNKYDDLIFYDVEVFPNLFLVNWKRYHTPNETIVRMINPSPEEIEELIKFKLVGFNCRRYDNHILYGRILKMDNEQLYKLSKKIIAGSTTALYPPAYNISYTDIYDFSSKKQSLKKWEVEMGITHKELGLPWDQPVPEERWQEVAEYCDNDVIATEALFDHISADFLARQILADIAGGSVNDTTNTLTQRIIFGKNRLPQDQFNYRNLAEPVTTVNKPTKDFLADIFPDMMKHRHGDEKSYLPYFPGYSYDNGVSTYRGEEVGEGGYVYAEPGVHYDVALLDITSMHPHSIINECLFGLEYTKQFYELVYARVDIKHEDWALVETMLNGKLKKYIEKVKTGEISFEDLAFALKIAINAVYGQTCAGYSNPFRDPRNVDNIVAKRGALFMVDLKHFVQEQGFTVAHIKTDSIKIPNATPEIIQKVMEFGKKYGYFFEHEATYDRMCLVNNAVYVAKYATADRCKELYGYSPKDNAKKGGKWTATGTQFQIPYVFKTLFTHEPIEFKDLCEVKEVKTALYLVDVDKDREVFIGRVGLFCPIKPDVNIKPGYGGMLLMRDTGAVDDDGNKKLAYAASTKGYVWLEADMIKKANAQDAIDISYYDALADEALKTINQYTDYNEFVKER